MHRHINREQRQKEYKLTTISWFNSVWLCFSFSAACYDWVRGESGWSSILIILGGLSGPSTMTIHCIHTQQHPNQLLQHTITPFSCDLQRSCVGITTFCLFVCLFTPEVVCLSHSILVSVHTFVFLFLPPDNLNNHEKRSGWAVNQRAGERGGQQTTCNHSVNLIEYRTGPDHQN